MLPSNSAPSYPGINLLRAFAALLVLAYHVIELGRWYAMPNEGFGYLLRHGWVGVDLFFTISGFVITLSALNGVQKHGTEFRRPFAMRRLARIVPLYLLTCAIFIVMVQPSFLRWGTGAIFRHLGSHLLFVHNLYHHTHGSINGPSWSIALEMQFYLLIMIGAPWLARTSGRRVLLYGLVVALAWRAATTLVMPPGVVSPIIQFIYTTQLPGVIDEFALGIVLAMVMHRGDSRLAAWLSVGWRNCLVWLVAALALLSVAIEVDQSFRYGHHVEMIVFWRIILSAGFACLLAAVVTFPWAAARVLAPFRYLGDISYGIYLWHTLVLMTMMALLPDLKEGRLLKYVLGCTILLAALTWHLVEKPHLQRVQAGQ